MKNARSTIGTTLDPERGVIGDDDAADRLLERVAALLLMVSRQERTPPQIPPCLSPQVRPGTGVDKPDADADRGAHRSHRAFDKGPRVELRRRSTTGIVSAHPLRVLPRYDGGIGIGQVRL